METIILYGISAIALLASLLANRAKTMAALKKAIKAFEGILPQFLTVLVLVAAALAMVNPDTIGRFIGQESGFLGTLGASVIGAVTLIPGFVAFPVAASLLQEGAGPTQLAAFVSSLMMVGIVTLPMEIQYFGRRIALVRNGLAWLFSLAVAYFVGWAVLA